MNYYTTLLEDTINQIYNRLNINKPQQLDMLCIANYLNIAVHFEEISSRAYNGEIIIDNRLSPDQQWEDFGHELCHILFHYGNQILNIHNLFLKYQEKKANNFVLHFCVPTFMLLNYEIATINEGVPFVAKTFNVTQDFARKRLIKFKNQLHWSKLHYEFNAFNLRWL